MGSKELVVYDPCLLSLIISFLNDHFDLLNLSLTSKLHRQTVLSSVQRITCRRLDKLMEIPEIFPNLMDLGLNLTVKKLGDNFSNFVLSKLSHLQISQFRLSPRSDVKIKRTALASLKTLSQLRVLQLERCSLDDQIAKQLGKGCKLLEDITLKCTEGSLTNKGVNDLFLSSSSGLRRLCLQDNESFEDDPMPIIIKCATLTSLVLINELNLGSSIEDSSFPNLKLNSIRELRILGVIPDHTRDFDLVGCFAKAIIRAGSPLEIVELEVMASKSIFVTLSNCTTLQSLQLGDATLDKDQIRQLFSKNHKLSALGLRDPQQPEAHEAMVEKILFVEGIRNGKGQNSGNENAVLDLFSRMDFENFYYLFGFNQKSSSRVQFLQEIELNCLYPETSFEGLYELFSVCTLLRKVCLLIGGEEEEDPEEVPEEAPDPFLCRALEALSGCPNLEELRAPLGHKILQRILSGVKGLQKLDIYLQLEDITDESLLLLKENSPNLRRLSLIYESPNDIGITDKGLEYLSFCSQLQCISIGHYEGNGSGLIHFEKRCFWLNFVYIGRNVNDTTEYSKICQMLKNRGCYVCRGVNR